MKIDLPNKKVDPATKEKMRKEGEVKKNQNYEKITGIFGSNNNQEETKGDGKVFEYHEKERQEEFVNDKADNSEDEIDYSHEHLEEFMKSLNEHNKGKGFKNPGLSTVDVEPKNEGNNTLTHEQADNLISTFLKNVNVNTNRDSQPVDKALAPLGSKRSESEIVSGNLDGLLGINTGATLSNSLAYSQTNASARGNNQFNSVSLVSGMRSRLNRNTEAGEKQKNRYGVEESRHKKNATQEYKLPPDDEYEEPGEFDRDNNDNVVSTQTILLIL